MTSLRAALFFLVAPGTVCALIPWLLARWTVMDMWPSPIFGPVAMLCGVAGLTWCFVDFVRKGKGTPNPHDPPKKLVTNGLYRYSRNPMYVSIVLILVGEAMAFGEPLILFWALAVAVIFHLRIVLHEEPWLEKTFGDEWTQYRQSVRRWL